MLLSVSAIKTTLDAYHAHLGWARRRAPVRVSADRVRIGETAVAFETLEAEPVLRAFIDLVTIVRRRPPRSVRQVRSSDIESLAAALDLSQDGVRTLLAALLPAAPKHAE